ncbi:MAG: hypothetical protein K5869_07595 [Saccharofermentans sp.]|nr:hypothetical protein [Saccharofermentans sp.]
MNDRVLYAELKGLRVVDNEAKWSSPNLFFYYWGEPNEMCIIMEKVGKELADYLYSSSTITDEDYFGDGKSKTRMISLADLKARLCLAKSNINKVKSPTVSYAQFRFFDQLKELVRQMDMIAELGRMKGKEVYLKFCIKEY